MNAFSTLVHGHQITAVGDLPPLAVRRIATSVRPRSQPE